MAGFDEAYNLLAPDPNADYGSILPFARDRATGTRRWAMPSVVREGLLGATDLAKSTQTGSLTGRGLETLLSSGLLGGGLLAPRGALTSGGGRGVFGAAPFTREELSRIVPAVRIEHPQGGVKVYAAKRGETHAEAAELVPEISDTSGYKFNDGFYDPQTKQYYTRNQMSDRMAPREANELNDVRERLSSGGPVY